MASLKWDVVGERRFETGVDRGVFYPRNASGIYSVGEAWNGLTAVTESPSGAETTKHYADNIPYLSLTSAEEFAATIEAFMWPAGFEEVDGLILPTPGLSVGQQARKTFGAACGGNDTVSIGDELTGHRFPEAGTGAGNQNDHVVLLGGFKRTVLPQRA